MSQPVKTSITPRNNNQLNNGNMTQRQISPTRFSDAPGTRIARRELWWKEPPASQVKVELNRKNKLDTVAPKVDHRNANYSPPKSNFKGVENQKLEWNVQSAVDTWGNFNHRPGGGNKKYPSDNLQWQATPKVDSGFIYTYE